MVNLVIVSHSHRLAEGVKELAAQMAQLDDARAGVDADADTEAGAAVGVQIATAGGILDDAEQFQLGTSTMRIVEAIDGVWTQDGVLLLVDLGSAVLSAEMALDLLPDDKRARCHMSNAPLVEGAVTAALEASLGHDLETVNRAAESARHIEKCVM